MTLARPETGPQTEDPRIQAVVLACRNPAPALPPETPATLAGSVDAVVAAWADQKTLDARSVEKYASILGRLARFAAARGVTRLQDVDAALVGAFTNALGRDRRGQVSSDVSGRTKSNRRSALRAFFAATSAAGWTSEDPAAIVELFNRKGATRTPRPLSDDEAERVRFLADDNPAWVRPAAVALMLCGAWASEAAFLAPGDFDPETRAVALPGMVGRLPRSVVLDERSARVVANRLAYLRLQVPEPAGLLFAAPRASHRQHIKVFNVARSALTRAGLDPDHEVTPASLTLWAARRVLDETGRVEEAARLIGAQSLDQTARDLRWDWNARAEEAPSS